MIDLLKDWIRDIFIVVTALCFAEIVLPQGGMKKYLKFIFSIIILGVVLSPLAHITDFDLSPAALSDEYYKSIEATGAAASVAAATGATKSEAEVDGSPVSEAESSGAAKAEGVGADELREIQSFQFKKIYEKKLKAEVGSAIGEYYPELKIYEINVIFNENQDDEAFAAVNLIVIKGEETEYVSNIIRCAAQRLGIEEEKLSYILPEENE